MLEHLILQSIGNGSDTLELTCCPEKWEYKHRHFTAGIAILTIILGSTYIFTSCRFYVGPFLQLWGIRKEPLTLPYWTSYFGNALSMTRDSRAFYASAMWRLQFVFRPSLIKHIEEDLRAVQSVLASGPCTHTSFPVGTGYSDLPGLCPPIS
jgi:hypothetical protein